MVEIINSKKTFGLDYRPERLPLIKVRNISFTTVDYYPIIVKNPLEFMFHQ